LFEYCPIGILPNLSCILYLDVDFSTTPKVALRASTEAINDIKEIYSKNEGIIGSPIVGKKVIDREFWKLAKHQDSDGGILHIACHGTFEPNNPMYSGLLLTDSKIDASEIARTPLKYDEVILSACSTGQRPVQVHEIKLIGDEILGMPSAFLESGVKSVLVSIPKAHDLTAYAFMTRYHEYRSEGKTPLIALQETQKAILSEAIYPPYLWIGFAIYGCH